MNSHVPSGAHHITVPERIGSGKAPIGDCRKQPDEGQYAIDSPSGDRTAPALSVAASTTDASSSRSDWRTRSPPRNEYSHLPTEEYGAFGRRRVPSACAMNPPLDP